MNGKKNPLKAKSKDRWQIVKKDICDISGKGLIFLRHKKATEN